ncbi:MAG: hypothetical protein J5971_08450 [Prevotella sp.]|nr:hypothetical protein [Prevotella sp.]
MKKNMYIKPSCKVTVVTTERIMTQTSVPLSNEAALQQEGMEAREFEENYVTHKSVWDD